MPQGNLVNTKRKKKSIIVTSLCFFLFFFVVVFFLGGYADNTCPKLPVFPNGLLTYSGSPVAGTKAYISCNSGSYYSGSDKHVICLPNGRWQAPKGYCVCKLIMNRLYGWLLHVFHKALIFIAGPFWTGPLVLQKIREQVFCKQRA